MKALLLLLLAAPAAAVPTFVKEDPILLTSATLHAMTGNYTDGGGGARFFYVRASSEVYSSRSADGLVFTEEAAVRLSSETLPALDIKVSSITGLSILPIDAGGFRMAYSVLGSTGDYRLYTASSSAVEAGLTWTNETGTVLNAGTVGLKSPALVELQSGDWRLYWTQDVNGGNDPADYRIYSALSSNEGRNFGAASQVLAGQEAREVSAVRLTNNRVRLYYSAPVVAQTTATTILSAMSTDALGTSFTVETGVRLSTPAPDGVSAPFVVRSTEAAPSYSWRLYYTYDQAVPTTASETVHGAQTHAPDPQSVSPASVIGDKGPFNFSISGEIISAGVTAQLTQSGQPAIAGSGLVRTDDQTLTVDFNTVGQPTGLWNLVLTNANGQTGTLANAVLLDFSGGSVSIADNLMRPRLGDRARVTINIFQPGVVSLKIFTLTGEAVATLYEGNANAGTTTFLWDGKNSAGRTVASGVYLLKATGPKLNLIDKIVVVK